MIRFVDLRGADTGYEFAFWDTVTDRFITVGNDQAWDSLDDLRDCAELYELDEGLERRLIRLCPDWVSAQQGQSSSEND